MTRDEAQKRVDEARRRERAETQKYLMAMDLAAYADRMKLIMGCDDHPLYAQAAEISELTDSLKVQFQARTDAARVELRAAEAALPPLQPPDDAARSLQPPDDAARWCSECRLSRCEGRQAVAPKETKP